MSKDNLININLPGEFKDHLTELLRQGAQQLLLQAVEAELAVFLESHQDKRLFNGRQRLVRHGHLPERQVVTGVGAIPIQVPRTRDRLKSGDKSLRFVSTLLPPYIRRSKSIEQAIPYLYL